MRVLVAGATGAVGRPLVRMLGESGHEVLGTTRSQANATMLRELGAEPVVCDALDRESLRRAVLTAEPQAIVNQLTDLSAPLNPRRYAHWLEPTNRLRVEATGTLAEAAVEAGAGMLVSQSVAFAYRWDGDRLNAEDDPLFDDGPAGFDRAVSALRHLEAGSLETPGLEGIVLRYGYFYGPGSAYARSPALQHRRRRSRPPSRMAAGVRGGPRREAAAAGAAVAGPDLRRPVHGRQLDRAARRLQHESQARAWGWRPRWPSWREGFREALG